MVPAGEITDKTIDALADVLEAGDVVIDGGNTHYVDDIRHAAALREKGIHHVDCGTSGGVWGFERGFCLMIGGETEVVDRLSPIFATLAPGVDAAPRTPGRTGRPEPGRARLLPLRPERRRPLREDGAQRHRVRADGRVRRGPQHHRERQRRAGAARDADAETAPLEHPELYQYDIDTREVAEVWRRGSVVGSWLLDLTAQALHESPTLEEFAGRVSDSGEGRWTSIAAIEEGVPAPVLTTALYSRFASRGADDFANRLLSAMRKQFGGHDEKKRIVSRSRSRSCPTPAAVARRGAEVVSETAAAAIDEHGRFTFAVSGGHTPWAMFAELRRDARRGSSVTIFQVDERVAPDGDPDRNLTHLLASLPAGAGADVRAMPVGADDLEAAAASYAASLPDAFDLVHLGLGPDGHTASLVPGDPVLDVADRDVAVTGLYQGRRRMTLTYPVLNRARRILWLVTGEDKVDALRRLRDGDHVDPRRAGEPRAGARRRGRRRGRARARERAAVPGRAAGAGRVSPSTSAARTSRSC